MPHRFLAHRLGEVPRVMRLIASVSGGAYGHGPVHLLLKSAAGSGMGLVLLTFAFEGFPGGPHLD